MLQCNILNLCTATGKPVPGKSDGPAWSKPVRAAQKHALKRSRNLQETDPETRLMTGMVAAIVVAAGRGERAGGDVPKQYRAIGGEPMIRATLRAFLGHRSDRRGAAGHRGVRCRHLWCRDRRAEKPGAAGSGRRNAPGLGARRSRSAGRPRAGACSHSRRRAAVSFRRADRPRHCRRRAKPGPRCRASPFPIR